MLWKLNCAIYGYDDGHSGKWKLDFSYFLLLAFAALASYAADIETSKINFSAFKFFFLLGGWGWFCGYAWGRHLGGVTFLSF